LQLQTVLDSCQRVGYQKLHRNHQSSYVLTI
jgi:hypothetical protein